MDPEEKERRKAEIHDEISDYETLKSGVQESIKNIDREIAEIDEQLRLMDEQKNGIDERKADLERTKTRLNEEKEANQEYIAGYDREIARRNDTIGQIDRLPSM